MMSKDFLKAERRLHLAHKLISAEDEDYDSGEGEDAELVGLHEPRPSKVKPRPTKRAKDEDGADPTSSSRAIIPSKPAKRRKTMSITAGPLSKPEPQSKRKSSSSVSAPKKKQKPCPPLPGHPTPGRSVLVQPRGGKPRSQKSLPGQTPAASLIPPAESCHTVEAGTSPEQSSSAQVVPASNETAQSLVQVTPPAEQFQTQRPKARPRPKAASGSSTREGGDVFNLSHMVHVSRPGSGSSSLSIAQGSALLPPVGHGSVSSVATNAGRQAASITAKRPPPDNPASSSTARGQTSPPQVAPTVSGPAAPPPPSLAAENSSCHPSSAQSAAPNRLPSSSTAQTVPSPPMLPPLSSANPTAKVIRLAAPPLTSGLRVVPQPPAPALANSEVGAGRREVHMESQSSAHERWSDRFDNEERALAVDLGFAPETNRFPSTALADRRRTEVVGVQPSIPGDTSRVDASRSRRVSLSPVDRSTRHDQPAMSVARISAHRPGSSSTFQAPPVKARVTADGSYAREARANRLLVPDTPGVRDAHSAPRSETSTSQVPGAVSAEGALPKVRDFIDSAPRPSSRPAAAVSLSQTLPTVVTSSELPAKKKGFAKPSPLHGGGSNKDTAAQRRTSALDDRDKKVQSSAARPQSPSRAPRVKLSTTHGKSNQPSKR
jgi:hypothetical protein